MTITINGIPNCDTVKKARKWLDAQGLDHTFRDFKKDAPSADEVGGWADAAGWEVLLAALLQGWRAGLRLARARLYSLMRYK